MRPPISLEKLFRLTVGSVAGALLSLCVLGTLIGNLLNKLGFEAERTYESVMLLSVTLGAMLGAFLASRIGAPRKPPKPRHREQAVDAPVVDENEVE